MRYFDSIGFCETEPEDENSDVWVANMTEKKYYGDVIRNSRRLQALEYTSTNDDVNISNQISLMADKFALEHFHEIRYAVFMGHKWKVSDIEFQGPRLLLTLGGVYNG